MIFFFQGHDDDLEAFILDANKFISAFRETRPHNARHIYLSALAISPTVEAHYRSRFPQLHLVVMRAFKLDHLLHVLEVPKSDSQESTIESSKVYPVRLCSHSFATYSLYVGIPVLNTIHAGMYQQFGLL